MSAIAPAEDPSHSILDEFMAQDNFTHTVRTLLVLFWCLGTHCWLPLVVINILELSRLLLEVGGCTRARSFEDAFRISA